MSRDFPAVASCRRLALAVVSLALSATAAPAGVWQWGCMGPIGEDQIVFNRGQLLLIKGRAPVGKLDDVVHGVGDSVLDARRAAAVTILATFSADDINGGFSPTMTFKSQADGRALALTEVASRRTKRTAELLGGCRDETTERFTKTYRLVLGTEPARTVTLACMEYMLSTRGGRTCR